MIPRLPDELFNRVGYPYSDADEAQTGIRRIVEEVAYKLPNVDETLLNREVWHAVCDFCARTGTLLERGVQMAAPGSMVLAVPVPKTFGRTMHVARVEAYDASAGAWRNTRDFTISRSNAGDGIVSLGAAADGAAVTVAEAPQFSWTGAGAWSPALPKYMIDRYGEAMAHGALMRIYALKGADTLAREHAAAYGNDLTRHSIGFITSGMRKRVALDMEDVLMALRGGGGGNG